MNEFEKKEMRLRRKLDKKNHKIQGLVRRINELEKTVSTMAIRTKNLPIDVERVVQNALCNVRMIPIIGGIDSKIVSVSINDNPKK